MVQQEKENRAIKYDLIASLILCRTEIAVVSLACCYWCECHTSGCQHTVKPGKREIHLPPTSGTKKRSKPVLPLVMAVTVKCMRIYPLERKVFSS